MKSYSELDNLFNDLTNIIKGVMAKSLDIGYEQCQRDQSTHEERQQSDNEIKVGDEVYLLDPEDTRIVTGVFDGEGTGPRAVQITSRGKWTTDYLSDLHKTGRHFPQMEDILHQLKGVQNG